METATNRDRMFPVLAGSPVTPQHILEILRHVDPARQTQGLSRRLTQFSELTLKSFPAKVEEILGSNHSELAKVLHRLAVLYHHYDELATAEPLYRRALEAAEKTSTRTNPELGLIMNNLGRLLHAKGELGEAETLYQRSLEILEQRLGADHPRLATPLANAASLSRDLGNYDRAEHLYRSCMIILEKSLTPLNPKVVKIRKKLTAVLERKGGAAHAADELSGFPQPH